MLARTGLLLLMVFLLASCEADQPAPQNGCVTRRCAWNPETQMFDRDCVFVPNDAALSRCVPDAGQGAADDG